MNPALSLHLDGLRAGAAAVVLLSHFAYERFTGGRYLAIRDFNLGSDAVVLFFVLSGLVIAYAAETKDRSGASYVFSRATRLYSVAVPAVLATLFLDRLGAAFNPAAYDGWWYNPASAGAQIAFGLSFTNEWLVNGFRMGSNGPYWSLSYEVAYYLIFGAAVYLAGAWRAIAVVTLCLLAGPRVLLLMPVWLMGVLAWRLIRRDAPALSRGAALAAAGLPPLVYLLALGAGLPQLCLEASLALTGLEAEQVAGGLRFSDEFLWNWVVGLLALTHIVGMAALARGRAATAIPGGAARTIRWWAGASFSLYLVHYPALQAVGAVLPEAMPWALRDAVLLVATTGLCLVFAEAFERPLGAMRAVLGQGGRRLAGALRLPTGPAGSRQSPRPLSSSSA